MKTVLALLLLATLPTSANAATLVVDATAAPNGNGSRAHPFALIQDGIDAASPGDVVRVRPGTYGPSFNGETWPLVMADEVHLRGSGPDITVLDGESAPYIVSFQSVVGGSLSGFEIRDTDTVDWYASAIWITNASPEIYRNRITGAWRAISAHTWSDPTDTRPLIHDNLFVENILNDIYGFRSGPVIYHNTMVRTVPAGAIDASLYLHEISPDTVIASNIIAEPDGEGIAMAGTSAATEAAIMIFYNDIWATLPFDSFTSRIGIDGNFSDDPFLDADGLIQDASSPCVDAAPVFFTSRSDFEGDRRPVDGDGDGLTRPDIGADEWVAH